MYHKIVKINAAKTVDKYSKPYGGKIQMTHTDIHPRTHNAHGVEHSDKDPKFKVGDHVRIWKHKNIFAKGCFTKWFKEGLVIMKIKYTVPYT